MTHDGKEEIEYADVLVSGQGILKYAQPNPDVTDSLLTLITQ